MASSREAGRVEAFTDSVFAIAITLLVLDLPVPDSGDFAGSLAERWPPHGRDRDRDEDPHSHPPPR